MKPTNMQDVKGCADSSNVRDEISTPTQVGSNLKNLGVVSIKDQPSYEGGTWGRCVSNETRMVGRES